MADDFKRYVAHKISIGDLLKGRPIFEEEKFKFLEIEDKRIARVNMIANVTEKFVQDGEKKFASMTIDDATGQIKMKLFGEDIYKFEKYSEGDTILVVGLARAWKDEIYLMPEIISKKDSKYLLVRKLELDIDKPKQLEKSELTAIKDSIVSIIKREESNGGADIEGMIMELKSHPSVINGEIKKLLEEGIIYEPRPGKVRYLG